MVAIRLHAPPVDADDSHDEPPQATDDLFGDASTDCDPVDPTDPSVASDAVTEKIGELETLLDAETSPPLPQAGTDIVAAFDAPIPGDAASHSAIGQSIKLVKAKTRYLAASLVLSELEQRRDSIKARIKSQKEIVAELYREVVNEGGRGDEDEDEDDDGDGDEAWEGGDEADEPTLAEPSREIIEGPSLQVASSWASTPTDRIGLDTIKGMGAKKLTAIYEAAPTLGKLESLRADVYSGGLTQIQGVGTAMADAIEDVILKWLTENRDSEVLGFAGGGDGASDQVADQVSDQVSDQVAEQDSQEPSRGGDASDPTADNSAGECDASSESIAAAFPQVDEPAVADAEPEAADAPAQPVGPPKKPKRAKSKAAAPRHSAPPPACLPDHLTDDDRGDLTARSALIRSRYLDGQFADTEATDEFSDGRDARCRDLAIADACNWMPGEKQDQWLLGWVAADLEIAGVGNHDAQTVGA